MPTYIHVVMVDRGPLRDTEATFYATHDAAMIGAVDAALEAIHRSHVRRKAMGGYDPEVVSEFLQAAMRQDWAAAVELLSSVRSQLAGRFSFPKITVQRKSVLALGDTDTEALSFIAQGALSHFEE